MFVPLVSILGFLAIGFAAFGLGRPVLRALRLDGGDRLTVWVFSLAMGAMAGAMAILALGMSARLTPSTISALTAVAGFWGVMELALEWGSAVERRLVPSAPSSPEIEQPSWTHPSPRVARGFVLASTATAVAVLLGALAPPRTNEILTRLELPQRWLVEQRIDAAVFSAGETKFQPLPDLWYLWALGIEGGATVQLTAFAVGVLCALATVVFASPILGRSWAWAAGMLVALTPGVLRHVAALDGHVAGLMFCTLAAAAWQQGDDESDWRWHVVSGAMLGGAIGTRALLPLLAALGLVLAWNLAASASTREHRGDAVRAVLFAGLAAAVVSAVWSIPPVDTALCIPKREAISLHAMLGLIGSLGAAFLAAAPGLLLTRPLRGLKPILAVLCIFAAVCLPFFPRGEVIVAAAPLLATACVWVWVELRRFPAPARRVAMTAIAAGLAIMAIAPWSDSAGKSAAALGWHDRESWLAERQPTWRAAEVANHLLPTSAHILSQDERTFFFQRHVTTEGELCRQLDSDRLSEDPARLSAQLRAAGFTHVLLVESASGEASAVGSRLSRLGEAWQPSDDDFSPILTEYVHTGDGDARHYRLMMLP